MLGFLPRLPARRSPSQPTPAPPSLPSLLSTPLAAARAAEPTPAAETPLSFDAITTAEQYLALSVPASDIVSNGRVAKFLIDLRNPAAPRVRFVNANFKRNGQT